MRARTLKSKSVKSQDQSENLASTIQILIDDDDHIIAGHGRVEAAKGLNITTVPAVRLSHLNEAEKRAYVIADNRLAEKAGWDPEILAIELQGLIDIGFAVEITGFETPDIDLLLEEFDDASRQSPTADDQILDPSFGPPVSRADDLWVLGAHRLLCGDARSAPAYAKLLDGQTADLVFTDPPYNVRIDGHVSGLGRVRHGEFAMACAEMTRTRLYRLSCDNAWSGGKGIAGWSASLCLYGLAASCRDPVRRTEGL
jgi:hypothetical protein